MASKVREQANEVCRILTYDMGVPASFVIRGGEVVFLITIITNPPYSGEGREVAVPSLRLRMAPPIEIAKGIKRMGREELLATQIDALIPDDF